MVLFDESYKSLVFFLANLVSELDNQSTYYNNIAINWSEIGYRLYLETIIVV